MGEVAHIVSSGGGGGGLSQSLLDKMSSLPVFTRSFSFNSGSNLGNTFVGNGSYGSFDDYDIPNELVTGYIASMSIKCTAISNAGGDGGTGYVKVRCFDANNSVISTLSVVCRGSTGSASSSKNIPSGTRRIRCGWAGGGTLPDGYTYAQFSCSVRVSFGGSNSVSVAL